MAVCERVANFANDNSEKIIKYLLAFSIRIGDTTITGAVVPHKPKEKRP